MGRRTAHNVRHPRFVLRRRGRGAERDGSSNPNALHSRKHDHEVQLCAFDILARDDDDLRSLPLHMRKVNLKQLLAGGRTASQSRRLSAARSAPDLFRAARRMGLEGLVSKHRERPYLCERQKPWVKVKNRSHPAMDREL